MGKLTPHALLALNLGRNPKAPEESSMRDSLAER